MVLDDYFERGIGSVNDEFKPIGIVALTIMMSLLKMDVYYSTQFTKHRNVALSRLHKSYRDY